jgi:hypothetical protein
MASSIAARENTSMMLGKKSMTHVRFGVAVALGVFFLAWTPRPLSAAGIGFRNDSPESVIVQGKMITKKMVKIGKPVLIRPKALIWDKTVPAGQILFTIYDANQPSRVLFQGPVQFAGNDLLLSIVPVPAAAKSSGEKPAAEPRVLLRPIELSPAPIPPTPSAPPPAPPPTR